MAFDETGMALGGIPPCASVRRHSYACKRTAGGLTLRRFRTRLGADMQARQRGWTRLYQRDPRWKTIRLQMERGTWSGDAMEIQL